MKRWQLILVLFISVAISFLLYGYSLHGAFVRDDSLYSTRPELHDVSYLGQIWKEGYLPDNKGSGVYRPLAIFTFALNFIIFGSSTFSFHIVNIILNGLVVWLVFLVVRELFDDDVLAYLSAFIFAFLPIHVEAVAFIKSRDELLGAFFGLLAWLVFIKATKSEKIKYWWIFLSSALFIIAVLGKETIFSLPALFAGTYWLQQKPKFIKLLKISLIFVPLTVIYFLIRIAVLGSYAFGSDNAHFVINPLKGSSLLTRFSTAFKISFLMLGKIVVPWKLSATYNFNAIPLVYNPFLSLQAILGFIFLAGIIALFFIRQKKLQIFPIAALTILVPYLMVSKFIFNSGELAAERWMYFPSIGVAMIIAFYLLKLLRNYRWIGLSTLFVILTIYGFITVNYNFAWLNTQTLGESMIANSPNSLISYLGMSDAYYALHDYQNAKKELRKANSIYRNYPPVLETFSEIAYQQQDYSLAATDIIGAMKNGDLSADNLVIYAQTLSKLREYQASLSIASKIIKFYPDNQEAQFVEAVDYFKMGQVNQAREHFNWLNNLSDGEKVQRLIDF